MTPRASGPPAVELMNAPGDSVTPPPVTSSRPASLVVSMVTGAAMSMLPVTNGVPLTLRYPTCSNPAVIEARSAGAKPIIPGEPAVPSAIPFVAVNGPTITVPVVPALTIPAASDTSSATIAMLPAAAAPAVLSIVPLLVKVAPAPPAINVTAPPVDATEIDGSMVRLAPPVVATVTALPFVVTPDNGFVAGPAMLAEEGIPAALKATPTVEAESAPMVRGAASFR